ncbi:MAG TPA: hypothetical protein VEI27_01400 [Dehalococcoidales bacterium]|nr:hypothetical protein [Dehalococcoidales bacterium]
MKTLIKRLNCPKCGKLVRTKENVTPDNVQVLCGRCNSVIWVSDGIKWRQVKSS